MTIFEEASAAGEAWYRIGEGRWVYGGYVQIVSAEPPAPPPPEPPSPPTPPPTTRSGVVTAAVLNVRGQPGVRADNPPIATLREGAGVTIYEETVYGGATWYRIGEGRWAHSGWIEVTAQPARVAAQALAAASIGDYALPIGWVYTAGLNVRARPGATADNPPLDEVKHNQALPILEQRSISGVVWCRIGEARWVDGSGVRVAYLKPRPTNIGPDERWVGVNLLQQTAVAYEGDRPIYAAMISSGTAGTPTVQGIFRTWRRIESGLMAGPGYFIEDVTWTCYFYEGYALHTAYWHDAFGAPRSHGCVNLSPYDAWWIFQWSATAGPTSPTVYVYWA